MRRNSFYEKTVFSSLILICFLALFFLGRPLFNPNEVVSYSIDIDITASELWPFLVEGEKRALWQTGLTSALPLNLGSSGVGSRSIVVYRVGDAVWDEEEKILDIVIPQFIRISRTSDDFEGEVKINIIEENEGVRVNYSFEKTYKKYSHKFFGPFGAFKEKEALEVAFNKLKSLVEK